MSRDNPDYSEACEAVRVLLRFLGEDVDRPGLQETPARVVSALQEMTSGMGADVERLNKCFSVVRSAGFITLRDIPFVSMCEHHMLPFTGTASIAYIPENARRVLGVSKMVRIVEAYARRLQVQERLTSEIAHALLPISAGVLVELRATHACMMLRGVRVNPSMLTRCALGSLELNHTLHDRALSTFR